MKKVLILILLCFMPLVVKASNDYDIKDVQIKVDISEEKTIYSETINCVFEEDSIITKELPSDSSNIKVSTNYKKDNNIIKIENNNFDNKKYLIKYETTNNGSYRINLANDYNANVKEVNFSITFFDKLTNYDIKFYLNDELIKNVDYNKNNYTITGIYKNEITEKDTLILEIVPKNLGRKTIIKVSILIPLVLCYLCYFMWVIFGRDREVKVEKTSLLIKNINPAEIAMLYNGVAKKEDLLFTIIDFANKGYIKIIEEDEDFRIIKLNDYNGKNYKEAVFFKNLFKKDVNVSLSEYITALTSEKRNKRIEYNKEIKVSEMTSKIHTILDKNLSLINSKEEKNLYFEKSSINKKKYLIVMVAINLLLVTSIPFIIVKRIYLLPISVLFSIFTLNILLKFTNKFKFENIRFKDIFISIMIMVLIITTLSVTVIKDNYVYFILYLVGVLSSFLMLILYKYMPKRTIHATNLLGKTEGIKEMILTGKPKEFERILELNPNYFYDVLPISFVMGISDEVIQKMKKFKIEKPSWFEIQGKYTPEKLKACILNMNRIFLYGAFLNRKDKKNEE